MDKILPYVLPTFTLSDSLSSEQKDFFDEYGFLHFKKFIDQETVKAVIQASLRVQEDWIKRGITKVNGVPVKYGRDLNGDPIVQRFAFINQHHTLLAEILRDPRIKALGELIGSGARVGETEKDGMVFNHYVNTPGSKFSRMGWHVDGLRDVFYFQKLDPMLNVGLHLSSLKPENGGLRIIPGTHKQSLGSLIFRKWHFLEHKADPHEVALIPEAGDLTVHDGRLWHRVAKSEIEGEASRRRVIYMPVIKGAFKPKNENSPTLFYQRFFNVVR